MQESIAQIIYKSRTDMGLTQDQFGSKYEVSGPAVFKFEKGYVCPSLALWLRMASDAGLEERSGVLVWLRAKLPEKFRDYVDTKPAASTGKGRKSKDGQLNYAFFDNREELREAALGDKKLPKALRDALQDDDLWEGFRPTGHELNLLRDIFGSMGKGSSSRYVDALRLIREFSNSF